MVKFSGAFCKCFKILIIVSDKTIGDFGNVFTFHAYSVNKRLFLTTVRGLSDIATTNVCKVDTSNRNHIERSRWMKWLITWLRQKKYPLIWIHYESPLFTGLLELIELCEQNPLENIYTFTIYQNYTLALTLVTFKWYLIIDDKSLPHKQRQSFTLLIIFKIKFLSEPPTRWLTGSVKMTQGEVTLNIDPHELINDCGPPAASELHVNHNKSWSSNLQLNLKIANFRVRLYGANQRPNRRWLNFRPNL